MKSINRWIVIHRLKVSIHWKVSTSLRMIPSIKNLVYLVQCDVIFLSIFLCSSFLVKAINSTSKSATTPKTMGLTPTSTLSPDVDDKLEADEYVHDFTGCCRSLNVTDKCLGFCTIHNIIDGTAGVEPDVCEADFPRIVKCMADGRNHLPCCERKKIPDVCQVRVLWKDKEKR